MRLVCAVIVLLFAARAGAQDLGVRLDGDQLRIATPDLRFLGAEAARRLRNGASVDYVFQISVSTERRGAPLAQAIYRFVFSYDLWEEKYAVALVQPSARSVSNLSAAAAESWCLESIRVPVEGLPADRALWLRFEYRLIEPPDADVGNTSGFTLSGLIDIFSRRNPRRPEGGLKEAGPFRLADLRRSGNR